MAITLKNNVPEPGRNEPCPCNSGLKYKFCHGDPMKKAVCDRLVYEKMVELIMKEKHVRGLLTAVEYSKFLAKRDPKTPREPVTGSQVDKLIDSSDLGRCADCGTVIPNNIRLCMKCKKKGT